MTLTGETTFLAHSGEWYQWGGAGWAGWTWLWFLPLWLVPILALSALAGWLYWRILRAHEGARLDRAREILAERYARGELSGDEYRERLGQL